MLEATIGRHRIFVEAPDLVRTVVRGDVSMSDVRGLVAAMDQAAAALRRPLALIDVAEMGNIPPEVRAFAARNPPRVMVVATAIHGASFRTRLVVKLILGATTLLWPHRIHPLVVVKTEVEARAWLEARRQTTAAGQGA